MFDDELPHRLVGFFDLLGITPAEAVLAVRDRLEKVRNSVQDSVPIDHAIGDRRLDHLRSRARRLTMDQSKRER